VSTVVVVEDSPALGKLLAATLTQAGHVAVWVSTGVEALKQAVALAPDVVLIDLHLDDMSGAALAAAMRSQGVAARLVALSGDAPEWDSDELFDTFMLKPVGLDALLRAVQA
jgi:DNA-binding response OmpR family regulator